jgi:isocitrate dehydrogenase (NAD+)
MGVVLSEDIAGKGLANPTAVMLAGAMLLDRIGHRERSQRIEAAIRKVIAEGKDLTPDLKGSGNTRSYTERVVKTIAGG